MYHEIPSALVGTQGYTGWYIVADLPARERSGARRKRQRVAADRIAALVGDEWAALEAALDPATRITDWPIFEPERHDVGDWWTGYLIDILGLVEGRRGRRAAERQVLCVQIDSAAWRTVQERKSHPGAPVADRWSGVTTKSFQAEVAAQIAQEAAMEARWLDRAATLADLERAEEEAMLTTDRARRRIEALRAETGDVEALDVLIRVGEN